jgi:drug/metabolite transporter (DMT)-like permease
MFILREIPTKLQLLFILLSFGAVAFILLMEGGLHLSGHLSGYFSLFGAVLCAGTFNVLSRKYSVSFTPVEITLGMMLGGALFFYALGMMQFAVQGQLHAYFAPLTIPKVMQAYLYLGVLASVAANLIVNFLLSKIQAARVSSFAYLISVISVLSGIFILHEPFYWYQMAGAAMILLGIWGTNHFAE